MATPLEVELKTYAHNKVGVHLKYEYDRQIDFVWKPHINLMVDAQAEALRRHQKVLDDVRKQIEKEREAAFGLVMLALSFAAGPVMSWVAGKIQYNWFPKYATSPKMKERSVFLAEKDSMWGKQYHLFETDHNKVHAKVFGDLGGQVTGLGINTALKVITPQTKSAETAVQLAASSPMAGSSHPLSSFKTNIENALAAQARVTSDAIMSLANSINENVNYGAECIAKLKSANPAARAPSVNEKQLEIMAKKMISDDIDRHRRDWAEKWFYYGYDPGSTAGMVEKIERELWALWIMNENLKSFTESGIKDPLEDVGAAPITYVLGNTFGSKGVPEGVLKQLAELGAVTARTQLQQLREMTARGTKEQQEAERKRRWQKEDDEAAAAHRAAMQAAEGAEDPARERANIERMKYQADQKVKARRAQEVPPEFNPVAVRGAVDDQWEVDALENWAKRHPPAFGAGQMTQVKRSIGSINDIYAKR